MRNIQVIVDTPLEHWRWLVQYAELQKIWFVPNCNGFNKATSCEIALSNCSDSRTIDFSMCGVCDPCFKQEFSWLIYFAERYYFIPDILLRCVDCYGRDYFDGGRRRANLVFDHSCQRKRDYRDSKNVQGNRWPVVRNGKSNGCPDEGNNQKNGERHGDAD